MQFKVFFYYIYVCLFNLSSLYLTVKLERPLINFNTLFSPRGAHIGMLRLHVLPLRIFVSTVSNSHSYTGFISNNLTRSCVDAFSPTLTPFTLFSCYTCSLLVDVSKVILDVLLGLAGDFLGLGYFFCILTARIS